MYDTKYGQNQGPVLRPRKEAATGFLDSFADDLVGAQYEDDWQALIDRQTAAGHGELERYRGDHWRRGEIAAEIQGALRTIDQSPQVLETGMRDETGVFAAARKAAESAMQPAPAAVGAVGWTNPGSQTDTPLTLAAASPRPKGRIVKEPTEREKAEAYLEDLDAFGGFGEPVPAAIPPTVNDGAHRIAYIWADQPAVFDVANNPEADARDPAYLPLVSETSRRTVVENTETIGRLAAEQGVDPELVKAIMYREQAGGLVQEMADWTGRSGSILPMNINPEIWEELGINRETAYKDPEANIRAGITLMRRIQDRLDDPTPKKIATLYNGLMKEQVSDYGARVARYYKEKPWLKPLGFFSEPSAMP